MTGPGQGQRAQMNPEAKSLGRFRAEGHTAEQRPLVQVWQTAFSEQPAKQSLAAYR